MSVCESDSVLLSVTCVRVSMLPPECVSRYVCLCYDSVAVCQCLCLCIGSRVPLSVRKYPYDCVGESLCLFQSVYI